MAKVANSKVYNFFEKKEDGSDSIAELFAKAKLSAKLSYKRSKNMKVLNSLYEDINQLKGELVKKYGSPSKENPEMIEVNPKKDKQKFWDFLEEFNQILAIEEEVDIRPFTLDEIEDKILLSYYDFEILFGFLIEEPKDENDSAKDKKDGQEKNSPEEEK